MRGAVDDQLRHCLAGRPRVENAPDAVTAGDIGAGGFEHGARSAEPVAGDRAVARLPRENLRRGEHRRDRAAHRLKAFDRAGIRRNPSGTIGNSSSLETVDISRAVGARKRLGASTVPLRSRYSRNTASSGTIVPVSNTRLWPFCRDTAGASPFDHGAIDLDTSRAAPAE